MAKVRMYLWLGVTVRTQSDPKVDTRPSSVMGDCRGAVVPKYRQRQDDRESLVDKSSDQPTEKCLTNTEYGHFLDDFPLGYTLSDELTSCKFMQSSCKAPPKNITFNEKGEITATTIVAKASDGQRYPCPA